MGAAGAQGEPFAAVAETHTAVVFFAGERVFKLKKPVDLGFVDFTSLPARQAACARETELNRRLAPDVYLGVGELREEDGQVADYLVRMRRMPASGKLSALVAEGKPVTAALREVARQLAGLHAASPRRPEITEQGSRDAVRGRWEANLAEAREMAESPLQPAVLGEVQRLAARFLAGREPLFDERMRAGRIVDGHGDLLGDDVFCLEDGPRLLDCLEFDDRLRWLDGLDDAACLAMDLERLGAPRLGEEFTSQYAGFAADPAPSPLREHYVAYRAFVRAKVACLRWSQGHSGAAGEARSLAAISLRHLRAAAPRLVLVGGLPGTGKSTLSRELAGRLGFTVLASDRIRKELAGLPPAGPGQASYGEGIYTAGWTERTYTELLDRAAALLARGQPVIADASWTSPAHRAAAARVADAAAAELIQLECVLPAGLAAGRLQARTGDVSDAGPEIAREMAAARPPWPEAATVDTSGAGDPVEQAIAAIRPPAREHPGG